MADGIEPDAGMDLSIIGRSSNLPSGVMYYFDTMVDLAELERIPLNEKEDDRRGAHWNDLSGKSEGAGLSIDAKCRNGIAPLVA